MDLAKAEYVIFIIIISASTLVFVTGMRGGANHSKRPIACYKEKVTSTIGFNIWIDKRNVVCELLGGVKHLHFRKTKIPTRAVPHNDLHPIDSFCVELYFLPDAFVWDFIYPNHRSIAE